ncbi:Protein Kinase C-Binding Protein Nell2 [Manis pentadactyla]|nr:Protein Kinase C-Binding Protein Nell2 [Manis pentadactyla]
MFTSGSRDVNDSSSCICHQLLSRDSASLEMFTELLDSGRHGYEDNGHVFLSSQGSCVMKTGTLRTLDRSIGRTPKQINCMWTALEMVSPESPPWMLAAV